MKYARICTTIGCATDPDLNLRDIAMLPRNANALPEIEPEVYIRTPAEFWSWGLSARRAISWSFIDGWDLQDMYSARANRYAIHLP